MKRFLREIRTVRRCEKVMRGLERLGRVQTIKRPGEDTVLFVRGFLWDTPRLGIYLHHYQSADSLSYHDHPSHNISIPLAGWAWEERPADCHQLDRRMGVVWRAARELHRIRGVCDLFGYWSIWIRGSHFRQWGFVTRAPAHQDHPEIIWVNAEEHLGERDKRYRRWRETIKQAVAGVLLR